MFDIECRDGKTGDGSFVAVTQSTNGRSVGDLPSAFFLERLFDPTGRFSFYGPPTGQFFRGLCYFPFRQELLLTTDSYIRCESQEEFYFR